MTYRELEEKSVADLQKLLAVTRDALRTSRFSVHQKQLKNIRTIRETKTMIARILTLLHGRTV